MQCMGVEQTCLRCHETKIQDLSIQVQLLPDKEQKQEQKQEQEQEEKKKKLEETNVHLISSLL